MEYKLVKRLVWVEETYFVKCTGDPIEMVKECHYDTLHMVNDDRVVYEREEEFTYSLVELPENWDKMATYIKSARILSPDETVEESPTKKRKKRKKVLQVEPACDIIDESDVELAKQLLAE